MMDRWVDPHVPTPQFLPFSLINLWVFQVSAYLRKIEDSKITRGGWGTLFMRFGGCLGSLAIKYGPVGRSARASVSNFLINSAFKLLRTTFASLEASY